MMTNNHKAIAYDRSCEKISKAIDKCKDEKVKQGLEEALAIMKSEIILAEQRYVNL